jgi:List-Bact-rpt repeat protein
LQVDVASSPYSYGTVTISPAGETAPGSQPCCTATHLVLTYPRGTVVTISATPVAGAVFEDFQSNGYGCNGTQNPCNITIDHHNTGAPAGVAVYFACTLIYPQKCEPAQSSSERLTVRSGA